MSETKEIQKVAPGESTEANSQFKPAESTLQQGLIAEAHKLLHDPSVSAKQANELIDRTYTQAESQLPRQTTPAQDAQIKLDHASLLDIYGFSHNDQASKDRAIEVLKSVKEPFASSSPEIVGALVQAKDGRPIDLRDGKARASAFENAAELTLSNSSTGAGDNSARWQYARLQLEQAMLANPEETKNRWHSFDRKKEYDLIMVAAKADAEESKLAKNSKDSVDASPSGASLTPLSAIKEMSLLAKPAPGEGDADGVLYLKGALTAALTQQEKTGDRELSKDELRTLAAEAQSSGDERKAKALEFAEENFDKLHLSGEGDGMIIDHKGISRDDIAELNNYNSFVRSGKWLGRNPLVSEAMLNRAETIGAGLGGLVEAASLFTGVGEAITLYAGVGGAVAGGVGSAGYSIYRVATDKNTVNYPTISKLTTPVADGIAGAGSGGLTGVFWGAALGATLGNKLAEVLPEKIWNWRHRQEYENLFDRMRGL